MTKNNKKVTKKIGHVKGNVSQIDMPNSKLTAGRDIHIYAGSNITQKELKDKGFDLGINPWESRLIRFGRSLLYKLGYKLFSLIFIGLIGGPIAYIAYGINFTGSENYVYLQNNLGWYFLAVIIIAFSIAFIGIGLKSRCEYCKKSFATIPLKKTLTDQTKYKDAELYNITEVRQCELCNKINRLDYTEEYVKETE